MSISSIDIAVYSFKSIPNTRNILNNEFPPYEKHNIIYNQYDDETKNFVETTTNLDNIEETGKKISLYNLYTSLKKENFIVKECNVYKLTRNINLSHYFKNNDTFIELKNNEIFDGQNYSINFGSLKIKGLFSISKKVKKTSNFPIIRNIRIYGGHLHNYSGFIIRSFQTNYILENCGVYSDNNSKHSGNIVGAYTGYKGSCIIRNCFSKGYIGLENSGGIVGSYAGYNGVCNVVNCYSTGDIYNSSGIVASYSGYMGVCNISFCFSTGLFLSNNCSGISHTNTGSYGICNIKSCFSNSVINNDYCSGIVGNYSAVNGKCNIDFCYHNNDNFAQTSSGIIGILYNNNEGSFNINNCFSNSRFHKFLYYNNSFSNINEKNTYSDKSSMLNKRGGLYDIVELKYGLDKLNNLYYDTRILDYKHDININIPILKIYNNHCTNKFSKIFYSYQLSSTLGDTYYDKITNKTIVGVNNDILDTINYTVSELNNNIIYNVMNTTFKRIVVEDQLLIYRDYLKRVFIKSYVDDIVIKPLKHYYVSGDNITIDFISIDKKLKFIIN